MTVRERRPDPVAVFAQRGVWQLDKEQGDQPVLYVGLNLHDVALNPSQRHRIRPGERR